jgi:phosphoenolpyruvate synthase/pyruvate phosphate dikinase
MIGEVPLVQPSFDEDFRKLLAEADKHAVLQVWANGDTPEDARRARNFGAKGIGLCRTEHMFMAGERLPVMQEMIIAASREERMRALDKLRIMQTEDFLGILDAMEGYPAASRVSAQGKRASGSPSRADGGTLSRERRGSGGDPENPGESAFPERSQPHAGFSRMSPRHHLP